MNESVSAGAVVGAQRRELLTFPGELQKSAWRRGHFEPDHANEAGSSDRENHMYTQTHEKVFECKQISLKGD